MPLSKAKNKERMKVKRATCVQPDMDEVAKVMLANLQARGYPTKHLIVTTNVQPIPNCPDGRYRE